MSEEPGRRYIDRVGSQFHLVEPAHDVTLIEVDERSTSISLLFTGDIAQPLEQATYTFRHPDLDDDAVFIVPIGPRDGHMAYEAVFTRAPSDDPA